MDANKDGGTGIEATFPDILLDDSTKLVSFSGTRFPWINKVSVNSLLEGLIAQDPCSE